MRSIAALAVAALAAFALPAPAQAGGSSTIITYGPPGYYSPVVRGYVFGAPGYDGRYYGYRPRLLYHRHYWRGDRRHHHGRAIHAYPRLSVNDVIRLLRRCDITHVRSIRLFGGVYKVRARDAYGRRVKLSVDPYTGDILKLRTRR